MITKENACAAIAWAKAHPDKIGHDFLATNTHGNPVRVGSPDATCFCILGLVAREAGMCNAIHTNDVVIPMITDLSLTPLEVVAVWKANDRGVSRGNPLLGAETLEKML